MERHDDIRKLIDKYAEGSCTPGELRMLHDHFGTSHRDAELREHLLAYFSAAGPGADDTEDRHVWEITAETRAALLDYVRTPRRRHAHILRWAAVAAAVLLVASVVGWWTISYQRSAISLAATDILPGGNRATLTLADGRVIDLNLEQEGIIIQDGITYLDGSQVMENEELRMKNERPSEENGILNSQLSILNSITTPKGGTYQITLPDGSRVWLNSASTLKYPSRFANDMREVILEGEAFFEIQEIQGARVSRVPFNVLTSGQTVEVLGTEFNISAYPDEAETKTTLVEGKVKVTLGTRTGNTQTGLTTNDLRLTTKILSPGQQAITRARPDESGQALPGQGAHIETQHVDVHDFTAWRDGAFRFNEEPLEAIMRRVARWYDVDVQYQDDALKSEPFTGSVSRRTNASQVLNLLERAGDVRFRIEGRTITVSRKAKDN